MRFIVLYIVLLIVSLMLFVTLQVKQMECILSPSCLAVDKSAVHSNVVTL